MKIKPLKSLIIVCKHHCGRLLRFNTLVLVLVLSSPPFGWSQDTTDNSAAIGGSVTLNFQDADIRALINSVSQITGKNFIVDPRVKGKVTLISGGKLSADLIYNIFLSVLEVHNFSAVPTGDIIKILPSNIIKQRPTPMSTGDDVEGSDRQLTQVYQLKHASVQEMVPILRPLLPPTSHFAPHAPTNTLVFTDTAANIDRVLNIITRLDQPDRRSDVHVVYLKFAQATQLVQILSQLAASMQKQSEPQTLGKSITVHADDNVNALIIQSPESEFHLLQAVIDQLDIERTAEGDVHVVYLKHAKAADLVDLLNNVVEQQGSSPEKQPNSAEISVQADESTNALVIRASEQDYQILASVIEKLDLRRAQVFVEAIIAEVSTGKAADIGVEWQGLYTKTSGGKIAGSTEFSEQTGGLTLGIVNKLVDNAFGDLVPDLQVILRALRADRNSNILSTPNILTLENEPAEIIVGKEVPFVTGQFVTDSATSTTTGGGDGDGVLTTTNNPFQTIERKDVGITLKLTPQINEGDTVLMEVEQEISSVSPITVQGASDLITDTRRIKATVEVDDGKIIVLGGLIRDDLVDTIEWVPILGKIPLLGALFRKKSKESIKTNLMVFIRPRIVRTHADLSLETQSKYEDIRAKEQESHPDTKHLIKKAVPPVLPEVNWDAESSQH